jgi:hypothetical protein
MKRLRPRLTYANVMATIAVFVALGGASYAALKLPKNSVGAKQLKKNAVTTAKIKKQAVTGAKVKKGTLTGTQINASTLGVVPTAQTAQTAQTANSLAPSEAWHEVGTPGEPAFQNDWGNVGNGSTVAFYKDHDGVVHLKGNAMGGMPNNAVFQLPPGYRPANGAILGFAIACECGAAGQTGVIHVTGSFNMPTFDGAIFFASSGTRIDLDGITFRAES